MSLILGPKEYLRGLRIISGLDDSQLESLLIEVVPCEEDRKILRKILAKSGGNETLTREETIQVGRLVHLGYYDHYTTQDPPVFEAEASLLAYMVQGKRNVLSLGSGPGLLEGLTAYNHPETSFLATDVSPEMLSEIRKKRQQIGLRNLRIRQKDVNTFSKNRDSKGQFDLVFSIDNQGWFSEKDLPANLKRTLSPGGEILLAKTDYVHKDKYGYIDPKNVEDFCKGHRCINFIDARKMAREAGMGFVTGYSAVEGARVPAFIFWKLFHNYVS
jgi:hypothetical protein